MQCSTMPDFSFSEEFKIECVSLCFCVWNLSPCLFLFAHRVPWCVVAHDATGAEWGTGQHGWRASWWEEKQSGAAQQHSGGPQQGECGEMTTLCSKEYMLLCLNMHWNAFWVFLCWQKCNKTQLNIQMISLGLIGIYSRIQSIYCGTFDLTQDNLLYSVAALMIKMCADNNETETNKIINGLW